MPTSHLWFVTPLADLAQFGGVLCTRYDQAGIRMHLEAAGLQEALGTVEHAGDGHGPQHRVASALEELGLQVRVGRGGLSPLGEHTLEELGVHG